MPRLLLPASHLPLVPDRSRSIQSVSPCRTNLERPRKIAGRPHGLHRYSPWCESISPPKLFERVFNKRYHMTYSSNMPKVNKNFRKIKKAPRSSSLPLQEGLLLAYAIPHP